MLANMMQMMNNVNGFIQQAQHEHEQQQQQAAAAGFYLPTNAQAGGLPEGAFSS